MISEIWDGDVTLSDAIRRRFDEHWVTTREQLADILLPESTRLALVKEEAIVISDSEDETVET